MARITLSCLPASRWCSVSLFSLGCAPRQRLLLLLLLLVTSVLLLGTYQKQLWAPQRLPGARGNKYLSMAESMEATDVRNPALNYGIVVDCGSSGSRVFVYYWAPHNGNPHTLLDIKQMRDRDHKPFVSRDLQQETLRQTHHSWLRSSFVYNHHLFSLCILVVVLAILLYILRLRRIHQREQRQAEALNLLWAEEGESLLP